MTVHISARLAWHDDGWNGRLCQNPKANTYCVGQQSFNQDFIQQDRDLDWEDLNRGRPCGDLDRIPPCVHSINAFGHDSARAHQPPPNWFGDETRSPIWQLPPSTVSIWPYEEMYADEVRNPKQKGLPAFDAVARRKAAVDYFDAVEENRSLVFYYANYSNPISEEDAQRYVVVGVSRMKRLHGEVMWEGQSENTRERYGPNVWMRSVTSHYPDQGLRIPYQRYLDSPDALSTIIFTPDNPRLFKYATRHISDDAALGLIERFAEVVAALKKLGDDTENWDQRSDWLGSVMAELWKNRGLLPGILSVFDYLKLGDVIPWAIGQIEQRGESSLQEDVFCALDDSGQCQLPLSQPALDSARKRWLLLGDAQRDLLRNTLPRFDLRVDQVRRVVDAPESVSVSSDAGEIVENPYRLFEQYVGMDPDDQITLQQMDHGLLPSPDLGSGIEPDDGRRLRALCVGELKRADQQTFLPATRVLDGLNHRLSLLPEWKRAHFTLRHLDVEKEALEGALQSREEGGERYLYLRTVFEDERFVEKTLRDLTIRPDIDLKFPVTEEAWINYLRQPDSTLARDFASDYESALNGQAAVCQKVIRKPLSVLCGGAGTGKTTIIRAMIAAIRKAHGSATSFQLLAPTGKAADRLRERTGQEAATVHSFLAQHGWLNENMTMRREGGQREEANQTYIIDEALMLDLSLLAALFRAINWHSVQRLILVGDVSQLPPIGTGKVFADLIDWLHDDVPEAVGELEVSMRQLENRLANKGTGILDLAAVFSRERLADDKSADRDLREEQILSKIQEGGEVSGDLSVEYWSDPEELARTLTDRLVTDMEVSANATLDPERPDKLWEAAMKAGGDIEDAERFQLISPYRGELYGVEHLNSVLQRHKNSWLLDNKGSLGGITYRDKVIQVRNRANRNAISAYNTAARSTEKTSVFNGEIGLTKVHGFDHKKWMSRYFRVGKLQVVFARKPDLWVEYKSEQAVEDNLELAYAITVHKAQGSEFQSVYFVLPKSKRALLTRELLYTGLTRARGHCVLFIEEDISPLLTLRRRESSRLERINSSLFEFQAVPEEFQTMFAWYEEGKIHRTLADYMVRSKSEVIIANMMFDREIPFLYEVPLRAPDGTFVLPDFTVMLRGETWYWEHEGMLSNEAYRKRQEVKHKWYERHGFSDRLIITQEEGGFDSQSVLGVLAERFGISS